MPTPSAADSGLGRRIKFLAFFAVPNIAKIDTFVNSICCRSSQEKTLLFFGFPSTIKEKFSFTYGQISAKNIGQRC